jgi:tetratricopeptide (TPR) repeat protein
MSVHLNHKCKGDATGMKGYLFRAGDWVKGCCIEDEQNGKMKGESGGLSAIRTDGTIEMMSVKRSSSPYICSNYWPISKRIKIFYAYAEKDRNLGNQLKSHLHFLKREITWIWDYDVDLIPGKEKLQEIDAHLNNANLILLLISADFFNSDFCEYIIKRAIEKDKQGEARIVPIILRPVILEGTPFADLQQLPDNKKPIKRWSDRDEAFTNVGRGILQVIRELKGEPIRKPDHLDFYQRGNALKKRKRYQEALAAYGQAIGLDPTFSDAYEARGRILDELKRFQEALADHEQAIGLDPAFSNAYEARGRVLDELKRFQEALADYEQAIRLDPNNAVAHYSKAMILYKLEAFSEARIAYNHAVEIDPNIQTVYAGYENALEVSIGFIEAMQTPDPDVSTITPASQGPLPIPLPVTRPQPVPPKRPLYQLPRQTPSPNMVRSRSIWKLAISIILVLFVISGFFIIYFRVIPTNNVKIPVRPYSISFSDITASFYANPHDSGTFDLASSTPLNASPQSFSTITFNPDLQKEHCTAITIDTKIRQFRDIAKKADGSCTVTIAYDSRGHQLGNGDRSSFEAVFIAFITVKSAGSLIISIDSDDGWILAIGKSGKYQPQADRNNIMQHPLTKKKLSAIKQYPEMGDYNIPSSSTHTIKVSFPSAGTYPVEIDYTECCGGPLVLVVTDEFTPSQS